MEKERKPPAAKLVLYVTEDAPVKVAVTNTSDTEDLDLSIDVFKVEAERD